MLTMNAKESLYNNKINQEIIKIIANIGGGMILHNQLIIICEEMKISSTLQIKSSITELIKNGFLKKKQVLSSKTNMLILTAYPLSRVLKIEDSRNVPEIATSNKSIIDNIFRMELILDYIRQYRIQAKSNESIDSEFLIRILFSINSTLGFSLRNVMRYMELLKEKEGACLSEQYTEDLTVEKVKKSLKRNMLAKYNVDEISPEDMKLKESVDEIKAYMNADEINRNFFNITNLKNSSADIEGIKFLENKQIYLKMAVYDNRNLSIDRICTLAGNTYNMLCRYSKEYEKPILKVVVYCANIDTKEYLEEEGNLRATYMYGYKDTTKMIEKLISLGNVRFPYCTENIKICFENKNIEEHYKISF